MPAPNTEPFILPLLERTPAPNTEPFKYVKRKPVEPTDEIPCVEESDNSSETFQQKAPRRKRCGTRDILNTKRSNLKVLNSKSPNRDKPSILKSSKEATRKKTKVIDLVNSDNMDFSDFSLKKATQPNIPTV